MGRGIRGPGGTGERPTDEIFIMCSQREGVEGWQVSGREENARGIAGSVSSGGALLEWAVGKSELRNKNLTKGNFQCIEH